MKENDVRQALDAYMDWLSELPEEEIRRDRKSTRLNSSH